MNATSPRGTSLFWDGVLAGLLCLSLSVPVGALGKSKNRMPEGSFLRHPAPTPQALNRQIASDAAVRTRYARLFRMAPQMVAPAFSGAHLTRLKRDQVVQVFYVRPGERIGYRLHHLHKGTLIYTLRDGTPALVQACGNPLRRVLPVTRIAPEIRPPGAPLLIPVTPPLSSALLPPALPLHSTPPPEFVEVAVPPPSLLPLAPAVVSSATATSQARHWFNTGLLVLPFGILPFLGGSSSNSSPPTGGGTPPPGGGGNTGGGGGSGGGGGGGGGGGFVPEGDALTLLLGGATPGLLLLGYRRLHRR